jgi:transcription antitermination factor NusG
MAKLCPEMGDSMGLLTADSRYAIPQSGFFAGVEKRWYAAYTRPRHEKCIAEELACCSVEHFLPLYRCVHKWKDRRKSLELPLFPNYIFVRISLNNRLRVLRVPGVVDLVGFGGTPSALPEKDIDDLREVLSHNAQVQPYSYIAAGTRMRITSGALAGLEGLLIRHNGKYHAVLSIDLIRCSMLVHVDMASVEILGPPRI